MPGRSNNPREGVPGPRDDWRSYLNGQRQPQPDRFGRRDFIRRAVAYTVGASAVLESLYAIFGSLPDYFSFNTETPKSTTVIPALQVNMAQVNIRTKADIAEAGNTDAPNTVRFDTLAAVGRKTNGSGQLENFDKTNPVVTLQNVPLVRGFNPDTGRNDNSGLWAAIPARFQEGLFFPGILDLKKDGWVYVSISRQTDNAVKVPDNQFQDVRMSPKDPRAGVITRATK